MLAGVGIESVTNANSTFEITSLNLVRVSALTEKLNYTCINRGMLVLLTYSVKDVYTSSTTGNMVTTTSATGTTGGFATTTTSATASTTTSDSMIVENSAISNWQCVNVVMIMCVLLLLV